MKKYPRPYSVDEATEDYIKQVADERFGGNESLALRMIVDEHTKYSQMANDFARGFGRTPLPPPITEITP